MDDYTKQKLESMELINTRLYELAKENTKTIKSIAWNENNHIDNRDNHKITVNNGEKAITCEISDTALADYQGKVGTEKTEALLISIINNL